MIANLFRLVSIVIFIGLYVFSFLPIIIREARNPANPVRNVSWWIFATLMIGLITLIPSAFYQLLKIRGIESNALIIFLTVTTTIGGYANLILLWLIFHFRFPKE